MAHSWLRDDVQVMKIAALVLVALIASITSACAVEAARPVPPPPVAAEGARSRETNHRADPQHVRTCYNAAETREKIASRRLSEPFRLLRGAAGRVEGEALRAKLCRWNDDYVYEIALLRRDGRIVHVYLNATNGQTLGAFNEH